MSVSYVAPKGGWGSETQNDRFPTKIALCLKKVCYKVDKVVKHSLA